MRYAEILLAMALGIKEPKSINIQHAFRYKMLTD